MRFLTSSAQVCFFITLLFTPVLHAQSCQNLVGYWQVVSEDAGRIPADVRTLPISQQGCRFFSDTSGHLLKGETNPNGGMYGTLSSNNPDGCSMAVRLDVYQGQLKLTIYADAHGNPCQDLPITPADHLISFNRYGGGETAPQNINGHWNVTPADTSRMPANLRTLSISQEGGHFAGSNALLTGAGNPNGGMYGTLSSNNPDGCSMAVRLDVYQGQLKLTIYADAHGNPCQDLPITPADHVISFARIGSTSPPPPPPTAPTISGVRLDPRDTINAGDDVRLVIDLDRAAPRGGFVVAIDNVTTAGVTDTLRTESGQAIIAITSFKFDEGVRSASILIRTRPVTNVSTVVTFTVHSGNSRKSATLTVR